MLWEKYVEPKIRFLFIHEGTARTLENEGENL